jgi:excisionase family DNA binding protein
MDMKFITPAEIAEMTGQSEHWVIRQCREGKLIGCKFGRDWRILPDDLEAWVESCKQVNRPGKRHKLAVTESDKTGAGRRPRDPIALAREIRGLPPLKG